MTVPIIPCKVNRVRYQVSSKGLGQDHLLLQFLLNVFCWINHPLRVREKKRVQRRTRCEDWNLGHKSGQGGSHKSLNDAAVLVQLLWQPWEKSQYLNLCCRTPFNWYYMRQIQNTSKRVCSDLVAKPGPMLLLNRQTLRISSQISQGILTNTIFFLKQRTQCAAGEMSQVSLKL